MIVDKSVVPGAGAFHIACAAHLNSEKFRKTVKGKARFGVDAFSDAFLVIPKTLAANSGHDIQDSRKKRRGHLIDDGPTDAYNVVASLQDAQSEGHIAGLDLASGTAIDPEQLGVYDSFRVLRNGLASSSGIASNLLW